MSLPSLLEDRVVFVVGATAGLGAGVARASARESAHVAVAGRRLKRAEALAAELRALGSESPRHQVRRRGRRQRVGCRRLHDRALRADQRACQLRRTDDPGHAAPHHARARRRTHRDQPARSVLHNAVGGRRHGEAWAPSAASSTSSRPRSSAGGRTSLRTRRPRPGWRRWTRNAAHSHRWGRIRINALDIGWTETRGRRRHPTALPRRRGRLGHHRRRQPADGQAGPGGRDRRHGVFLLSDRSGVVTSSVIDWDQNILGCHD